MADSVSVSLTEYNEKKVYFHTVNFFVLSFLQQCTGVTFGGLTLALTETVCIFSATVRFEIETFGFKGNVIKYSTDNLLASYNCKLVKSKQGVN